MKRWVALFGLAVAGCGPAGPDRVVLYCAQDAPFADRVLAGFAGRVEPKFDTEAAKSVGLFRELQLEAGRPRCDVHWNNEILTTLLLQKQGILQPYPSPSASAYPDWAKAKDHTWTAFASRARVLIVNTERVPGADTPASVFDLVDAKWSGRAAIAKPLFGTTSTHAACLFEVLGDEAATAFFRGLKANGVQILAGNKRVAEAVGRGDCAFGLTDTDDAILELLAGRPVRIIFPDHDGSTKHPRLGTLFIPNTLAVIRDCPNPRGARALVDYLLSEAVEALLAEGGGHQIPLNPNVKAKLPPALEPGRTARPMQVDFARAAEVWERVQAFLREEFAR